MVVNCLSAALGLRPLPEIPSCHRESSKSHQLPVKALSGTGADTASTSQTLAEMDRPDVPAESRRGLGQRSGLCKQRDGYTWGGGCAPSARVDMTS